MRCDLILPCCQLTSVLAVWLRSTVLSVRLRRSFHSVNNSSACDSFLFCDQDAVGELSKEMEDSRRQSSPPTPAPSPSPATVNPK